ncbi:hypothetical protein [Streptomyces violens]|uniref:hypothetical protein n=1 Tax=Streptomyces violens TaxID=66377 RepID=UPI0004C0A52F|nr:hypothetical protein [Streptomyces violens]
MSWKWEYAFGAEQASHTAPPEFVSEVEKKVAELVRMCEAKYLDGTLHQDASPRGGDLTVPGGMFRYQIVIRRERVYIVQITYLGF